MNVILALALMISLALGGSGAVAYAAQGNLPDDALYGVKLATEQMRLNLAGGPQAELNLLLELAQTRTQEMTELTAAGRPAPAATAARLESHLTTALQLAAGLDDAGLAGALAQIEQQTQTQAQLLVQADQAAPADAGLRQAEQALRQTRALAQLGLDDAAQFRAQVRTGNPSVTPSGAHDGGGAGPRATSTAPVPPAGYARCTTTPAVNGGGPGPNPTGTPMSGGGGSGRP